MLRPTLVVMWFVVTASGCALTTTRPPTPAAQFFPGELDQIPNSPDDRFYILVFGSESFPKRPKYTHSWATVVRTRNRTVVDHHTISWMPATLQIEPLRFTVEPGVNLGLHQTICNSLITCQRIAMWGPYEIKPGLYHRFKIQKAFLESGVIGYQCIDSIGEARQGNGCDCIHAITDMDPEYSRGRYPLSYFGIAASGNMVWRIMQSPVIMDPRETHDWIVPLLGLDAYPIQRRTYRGPYIAAERIVGP